MGYIDKGIVSYFVGLMPVVQPSGTGSALTPPLVNKCSDVLYVGDTVAFMLFEDGTGVALAKM